MSPKRSNFVVAKMENNGEIEMTDTLGKRLKMIRKKENLILKEVAAICNVTVKTLSRYENDQRTPDNDFLKIFVTHFKISTDWLLFGESPIYKAAANPDRNIKEAFIELSDLIFSQEIANIDIPEKLDFTQIVGDTPGNYLLLIKYMLKYPIIRKGIFQFFHFFLKPLINEHPELVEQSK
jgi:transcriptional regulator with XRE-family HTH domain